MAVAHSMIVLWILFVGSLVVLPTSALLALRWAVRSGQLRDFQKGALLVFDDEEPVGQITDHFPGTPPGSVLDTSRITGAAGLSLHHGAEIGQTTAAPPDNPEAHP